MSLYSRSAFPEPQGLYHPSKEHESCGLAFIANIKGHRSHKIISDGLTMLKNLTHRGAAGADPQTGDGAGILMQIPDSFFRKELEFSLPALGKYACGNVFVPKSPNANNFYKKIVEDVLRSFDLKVLGWRKVPTEPSILGQGAKACEPEIFQVFLEQAGESVDNFGFILFRARKKIEKLVLECRRDDLDQFYVCSLSDEVIVYKGMFLADQLHTYFKDLDNPLVESAVAIVHQRFSTNTFPSWKLAHPYRICAHNGEFNTIQANTNMMRIRENHLNHPKLEENEIEDLKPIIAPGLSDSASFDNAVEFFCHTERSLPHTLAMMVPEAWRSRAHMDEKRKYFFLYHSNLMEPWDGPATIAGFHNDQLVATLDRNGLRPARFCLTTDNRIIFGSEAGMLALKDHETLFKGRLWPGKMIYVDMKKGVFMDDDEAKKTFLGKRPYDSWLHQNLVDLEQLPEPIKPPKSLTHKLHIYQKAFAYSEEELMEQLVPMFTDGQEAVGSMGNDSPLAILSEKPKLLFDYFRQRFAQVTNPAIDPIREEIVMGMNSYFGTKWNAFEEGREFCRQIRLTSPIINNFDLEKLAQTKNICIRGSIIPIIFDKSLGANALETALSQICKKAEDKIHLGYNTLILSDRGIDERQVAIPAVLATASIHFHLINKGKRGGIGIILETGQARLVHHMAVCIAYGANAINPYLAFECIRDLRSREILPARDGNEVDYEDPTAFYDRNYHKALDKGLYKIMSKMGVSTIRSYHSGQIFELIGLSEDLAKRHFNNSISILGGIGLKEIQNDSIYHHQLSFANTIHGSPSLPWGGDIKWTPHGEKHLNTPSSIALLQQAVREGSIEKFKIYSKNLQRGSKSVLRSHLETSSDRAPIAISQVEPAYEIVQRFVTGAMSLGALSPEAHENLAIAMNALKGKSNSGEGGEDPIRFKTDEHGRLKRSAIKQIASGRFGVTTNYLVNASELQIKIAQGAKPGEGGQLPGHKVNAYIAKLRHSIPGVSLISPPPHHDIYSIEDLAQLIFDLKNVNPGADISVKLVSEWGVGTIAAGVAKAHADTIIIAGHDGGTGASPISSTKHAGMPWELGLAETQQTLLLNGLRGRVKLQADGQMKTGRDVVIAALLGAEEFGFATLPLIAQGCILMRKCHLDTCPVGIATQNTELRKNFDGKPEHIMNLMNFIAEEVREILASLGYSKLDEIIGKSQILKSSTDNINSRSHLLNWDKIFYQPEPRPSDTRRKTNPQEHGINHVLDKSLIEKVSQQLSADETVKIDQPISTQHRSVGTMLSGWLSKKYGQKGLPEKSIQIKLTGSSGQSLGAFLAPGIYIKLEGEANDYLGKGMSGGLITIRPGQDSSFFPKDNWIAGNALLYGATGGQVYISGRVGERFAVRNSGCIAVVEGAGDHACEYMTGGKVVVLGHTGRNFAAGMSGGIAYVFDEEGFFSRRCNIGMVDLEQIDETDYPELLKLINNHYHYTQSKTAKEIIENWDEISLQFIKVIPREYKRYLRSSAETNARSAYHG
ncbi:MAG: glutamate synthase large subunit [Oligoflexales bacterium]